MFERVKNVPFGISSVAEQMRRDRIKQILINQEAGETLDSSQI